MRIALCPLAGGRAPPSHFIVALMTDMLSPQPGDVILEIGGGSGYQAAVLSLLVRRIYTVEIIPVLAERASDLLRRRNMQVPVQLIFRTMKTSEKIETYIRKRVDKLMDALIHEASSFPLL